MALIQFYKPTIRRNDMKAVLETMVDEKIGPGEKSELFINQFSRYLNLDKGIALRHFYDALKISLNLLGLKENDKVLISALSPKIYKKAIESLCAEVVIKDISIEDGMIDIAKLQEAKNECCDFYLLYEPFCQVVQNKEEIKNIGFKIIEDISHSIGSAIEGEKNIPFGDIVICSFEENDIISTAGGAALLTNENYLDDFDIDKNILLSDLNASLGIVQLNSLALILNRRNELYRLYINALMKTDCKVFGQKAISFFSNGYLFCALVNSKLDDTIEYCKKYGVSVIKAFDTVLENLDFENFKNASTIISRGVAFPLYPFLNAKEVESIVKVLSHLM